MAADSTQEIVEAISELDDDAKAAIGKELAPHIPVTLGRRGMLQTGVAALLGASAVSGGAAATKEAVGRAAAADGVLSDINVLESGDGTPIGFGNAVEFDHEAVSSATTIGNVTVVEYDSSIAGFTITIPASLEVHGMVVRFLDTSGSADTNNVTVNNSAGATIATIDAQHSIFEVWWDGGEWLNGIFTERVDAGTIATGDGTIAGFPFGRALAKDDVSSVTIREEDLLTVSGDSYGTIFSIGTAEYVMGGNVYGFLINKLRFTYSDDTTKELSIGSGVVATGDDQGDNRFTVLPVPPMEDVKKLEVFNENSGATDVGAVVYTV